MPGGIVKPDEEEPRRGVIKCQPHSRTRRPFPHPTPL